MISPNLRQQMHLLGQFTARAVQNRARGSALGLLWLVLMPILLLGLYYFVFGIIFEGSFGMDDTPAAYAMGIFIGLSVFGLFSDVLNSGPMLVVNNANLVKKVIFPLWVLPLSNALASAVAAGITLVLAVIGLTALGLIHWSGFLGVFICLPALLLLVVGLALGLSALGVFFRDLMPVMNFLSTAMLYGSGVFYTVEQVPEHIWRYLQFNPVVHLIDIIRGGLLFGQPFYPLEVLFVYALALVFFGSGFVLFAKLRPSFADVL